MLEAVPNFSEGRDPEIVAALVHALASAGAVVSDVHLDADHHRCVLTAFGDAAQLALGLEAAAAAAIRHIDLRAHAGVHPRVGACDVLPIVPLDGVLPGGGNMAEAMAVADDVAARIGALGVPVIRYGHDAQGSAVFAGALRAGGMAGLAARMISGELQIEAGPRVPHVSAGAVLVGVRPVLVAFNVDLDSDDLAIAQRIACAVRERDGGLPGVRALGLQLERAGRVQVSTNVERPDELGPGVVLEHIAALAAEEGVAIHRCELVGLAPADALDRLHHALRGHAAAASQPGLDAIPLASGRHPSLELHAAGAMANART